MNRTNFTRYRWRALAFAASPLMVRGACGYDFPLSESAIRDAYFLGSKGPSQGQAFPGAYTHAVNALKVSVETPFAQIAVQASKAVNYSAQDAMKEFLGKPAALRMHLDICYLAGAPENAIKIRLFFAVRAESAFYGTTY